MSSSVKVITLGCSKNRVDSEHLMRQLEAASFEIVPEDSDEPCDVVVLNTCSFINDAKEESIAAIFDAVDRKNRGEVSRIFVFGCLSQRYAKELPEMIPEVDGFFGASSGDLVSLAAALGAEFRPELSLQRYLTTPRHYAYLKISEGCDRKCAYCAIPGIRGRHVSAPIDDLVEEAEMLAAKGVRELIVIAQDTTYYGLDLYGKRMIAPLLRRLSEIDGIKWIRLHYSYPNGFPDDLLEEMAGNPKICKYLDIPLQHCSTKVLDKMRRNITGEETVAFVKRLRSMIPGIALRTTLIVGHPGEGLKEFGELLDFVREMRFERLGAFAYSEEEGTYGAENYRDSVSRKEKRRRLEELMSVQRGISASCNASRVGSAVEVVADSVMDGYYVCRSMYESPEVDGEILVRIPENEDEAAVNERIGKFFEVKISRAGDYDLYGEII